MVQGHPRGQPAALAHHAARTDETVSAHGHAGTDLRRAFNNGKGTDAGSRVDHGIHRHDGGWVNTRQRLGLGVEQMGYARVGQVRVRHDQGVTGKILGIACLEQHGRSLAVSQVLAVLRVCQKAQLPGAGLLQRGQPADFLVRRTTQGGAEGLGQLAELECRSHDQRDWFMRSMTWRVMSY
ncbi:hypothetical protein D3C80_1441270 [compost metagenome]